MRLILPLLLAIVLVVLSAGPAFAAPKVDGVFDLPGVQTNGQLTVGPDGNVWVALEQAVGKVTSAGGTTALTTGGLADQLGFPTGGITSAGGFIWISQGAGAGLKTIVKIPPGNPAGAQGVDVPGVDAGTTAMTTGPDGNVWVGQPGKLIKFSPGNPTAATPYDMPGVTPRAIAAAPDGTLWMTDPGSGHLWNVPTAGQFVLTGLNFGGQPQFLAVSPDGHVAFGNPNSDPQQIGIFRLEDPAQQPLDRPNGSDPFGVAFGADGAFWIAEFAGNRLARVTPSRQLTTLGGLPVVAGQGPRQIVAGPGNTLWATLDKPGDPDVTKIARITGLEPPAAAPGGGTPGAGAPGSGTPGGGTPADTTRPTVTAAKLSKASFTVGAKGVSLRFTLSEPATAKLVLSRRLAGRRRGTACVKPTRKLRRAKVCARLVSVRTITSAASAGANAIALDPSGLGAAGRYSAVLTVRDAAGNQAAPVTRAFTVVRKSRRR